MPARDWDASTYDRVSDVQEGWARRVLDRLPLSGDEVVLDAGCGSGRVTRLLLERLPRGRVIAVDASAEMVAHARRALDARATVLQAELTELELPQAVDAVFSNAVFHWIPDHARLFRRLHAALRPGGALVAQCGGRGNLAAFLAIVVEVARSAPFDRHLAGLDRQQELAGPEETRARLRAAGFEDVRVWLVPSEVTPQQPAGFLRAVLLRCHLDRLPPELREPFVAAVLASCGAAVRLDFQRLNIVARRGQSAAAAAPRPPADRGTGTRRGGR